MSTDPATPLPATREEVARALYESDAETCGVLPALWEEVAYDAVRERWLSLIKERDAAEAAVADVKALLRDAAKFVGCFIGADADEAMTCPKVDIPKDGYPRQYAVHAAAEMLARIDAALSPSKPEGEARCP